MYLTEIFNELNGPAGSTGTTILPADIIGLNLATAGQSSLMYAGKPLSWVRDTAAAGVQTAWAAAYRDVIVIDPLNHRVGTYNLTTYSLAVAENKAQMKSMIAAAATPADTDNDKLPDYWERWAFGDLSRNGATTGTNGLKTLHHWAHCSTAPATGIITGLPGIYFTSPENYFSVFYTRRRGTAFGLTVLPEFSPTLTSWTTTGHGYEEWGIKPRYDGSGGETVEWHSTVPAPQPFVRIKAALP